MDAGRINRLLGIPPGTRTTNGEKLVLYKREMVRARRIGDDALAAELSQVQQVLKRRRLRRCLDCGIPVRGERCKQHAVSRKWHSRSLPA